MSKFGKILVILLLICAVVFGTVFFIKYREEEHIKEVKAAWHVEIVNEYLTLRKEADQNSSSLGKVNKGEVFKVIEYENRNGNFWYHIEYDKNKTAWVGNPIGKNYLKDVNNKDDIKAPTIRFFESVYYVDSIEDINYEHLEVIDDKPGVEVTHKVYHEVDELNNKDQYWILYIATDKVGKTTKKVQKIEFNKKPSEDMVLDFSELER